MSESIVSDEDAKWIAGPPEVKFKDLPVGARFRFTGWNTAWIKVAEDKARMCAANGSMSVPRTMDSGEPVEVVEES